MKHLIIWSGGYDSTAVVRSYLESDTDFDTLYITLENNELKSKMEKRRRDRIKKLFYREYGKKFNDILIKIPEIQTVDNSVATFHQPHLWIFGLIYSLTNDIEYESAAFSYLKYADFWHIKEAISDYYEVFKKVVSPSINNKLTDNISSKVSYHFPTLYYPLEWFDKNDVINKFYSDKFGKQLFNLCWTCEQPINRHRTITICGSCNPCLLINNTLKEIAEKK